MKLGGILGSISPLYGIASGQGVFGNKGVMGSISPLYGMASGKGLFGQIDPEMLKKLLSGMGGGMPTGMFGSGMFGGGQ